MDLSTVDFSDPVVIVTLVLMCAVILLIAFHKDKKPDKNEVEETEEENEVCEKCGGDDFDYLGENPEGLDTYRCTGCGDISYEESDDEEETTNSEDATPKTEPKNKESKTKARDIEVSSKNSVVVPKRKGWF